MLPSITDGTPANIVNVNTVESLLHPAALQARTTTECCPVVKAGNGAK